MTGFLIVPTDHPHIAVESTKSGGIAITVGTSTTTALTVNEARQLAAAIQRAMVTA